MRARRPALLAAGASGLAVAFAIAPVAAQAAPVQAPASVGLSEDGHLAAGRNAQAPLSIAPDYGNRKVYIQTELPDHKSAPLGSVFTVTERNPDGSTLGAFACTDDLSAVPPVQPCGQAPFGIEPTTTDSTLLVVQASAPAGYIADPTPRVVPVCTDPTPGPLGPACSSVLTFTIDRAVAVTTAKKTLTVAKNGSSTIDPDTQVNRRGVDPNAVGIYGPAHGTVTVVQNGTETVAGKVPVPVTGPFTLRYTPATDFVGPDAFKYYVQTPGGKSDLVSVVLSVKGARPTAVSDSATTTDGVPATVDALANDKDNGGGTIKLTSVTRPAHGTVKIVSGEILYSPTPGYRGRDQFYYTVSSYSGLSNLGRVSVTVTP